VNILNETGQYGVNKNNILQCKSQEGRLDDAEKETRTPRVSVGRLTRVGQTPRVDRLILH